jgi:hypothetical protein
MGMAPAMRRAPDSMLESITIHERPFIVASPSSKGGRELLIILFEALDFRLEKGGWRAYEGI